MTPAAVHEPNPPPGEASSRRKRGQDPRPRRRTDDFRPEGPVVNGNGRSSTSCRKERTLPTDPRTRPSDRLLTAAEVADILAVPESWVREATRAGRLPHLKLGRYRRYSRPAIEAWLHDQQQGPPHANGPKGPDLHHDPASSL